MSYNQTQMSQQMNYEALKNELRELEEEWKRIVADLQQARANQQPTFSIYADKQACERKIQDCRQKILHYEQSDESRQAVPDLTQKQFIIGTSSVRRKTDAALRKTVKKEDSPITQK